MRSRDVGFSLVEILVATGVLVAVFVPIMIVFTRSVRQAEVSLDEIVATNLAEEIVDQLQIIPLMLRDFEQFVSYPALNTPPTYPKWSEYKAPGMAFPRATPGLSTELDTQRFTITGIPYPQEETPKGLECSLRLYLSPLPERFSRRVKVHRCTDRAGSIDENPNMVQLESLVEWEDRSIPGPHPRRQVTVKAIVARPTWGWGGL